MVSISRLSMRGFKSFGKFTAIDFPKGFTAVVGPNGSGKCVTGDTNVTLSSGARVRIADLVEEKLKGDHERLDDGFVAYAGGVKTLTLDPTDLKLKTGQVLAFVKRKAPARLLKITTRSGTTVTTTPYHPLFTINDGDFKSVEASKMKAGLRIATPRKLPTEPDACFLDLTKYLTADAGLYVPSSKKISNVIRDFKRKEGLTWRELAVRLDVPYYSVKGFADGQAINAAHLFRLLSAAGLTKEEMGRLVRRFKAGCGSHPVRLPWHTSAGLFRFLGYIISEGRSNKSNQLWFVNSDAAMVADFCSLSKQLFDKSARVFSYKKTSKDALIFSRPVAVYLEKVFGYQIGGNSRQKLVPPQLFAAKRAAMLAFLDSLFSGDGYVSDTSVEYTSASRELVFGVKDILLRLGVVSRVAKRVKFASNTKQKTKRDYYTLTVYGVDNFRKLKDVTFTDSRKNKKFRALFANTKRSNPNLDIVPKATILVKKLRDKYKINVKRVRKANATFAAYTEQRCEATRPGLRRAIRVFEAAGVEDPLLDRLSLFAESDIYWDEIVRVEEVAPKEEWVYDLCVDRTHNFVADGFVVHNSNVIDSLCFVLGRRSVKSMRADRLQELLFNGAKEGKAAERAVVAIKLDNTSGELPFNDKEVEVERDIGRDGKSTFRINGVRSTRAQIVDVLSKARIHPDGHNIVLQGDVASIIEMNSLQRREILDEISGIAEYEEKKQRAVHELGKVDIKIGEAKAVFREREKYLKTAEADRNKALRYQEINHRLSEYRGELFAIKLRKADKELELIGKDYRKIDDKEAALKEKQVAKEKEIEAAQKKINQIDEVLLKSRSLAEGTDLDRKRNEVADIEKGIGKLNEFLRLKEEELASIASKEAQNELKKLVVEQSAFKASLKDVKSKFGEQDALVSALQAEKISLTKKFQAAEQELTSKNRTYAKLSSAYEAQQSGAGYPHAIQEVLGLKKELGGIHGVVSELADVPDRYQLAISVAAGRRLYSVVVDSDAVAEKCINHLKSRKAGRATFLPLNKLKGFRIEKVAGTKNAIDLVSFKPEYRPVFEYVLQDTLVLDSIADARRLGIGKYRMVTLEGELFEKSGAITGGSVKETQGFSKGLEADVDKLGQELKAIEAARNSFQFELQQKTDEYEKAKNVLFGLEREREKLAGSVDGTSIKMNALSGGDSRQKKIEDELESKRKELESESARLQSAQQAFESLKSSMVKAEGRKAEERKRLAEGVEKIREETKQVYLALTDIARERNDLDVEKAKINQRLIDIKESYKGYEGKEIEVKHGERDLENLLAKYEKELADIGSVNMLAIDAYDSIKKDYDELVAKMSKLEEEKKAVFDFMEEIEHKKKDVFMETFLAISQNFEETFRKLSPGGAAHLILENPDNPFAEGSGMLIQAKPKGKELINIEALSGGEKTMTALAFIFAIQLYRPAPFYILDEVDAALDKVNSDMLGKMIAESAKSGTAQFIVITHNDSVLEQADRLYGVTMTPHGSQIVGVEME